MAGRSPGHPGGATRQWLNDLYCENRLFRGELVLSGERIDLKKVTMPVLNIYTETDHIIPPEMSLALRGLTGTSDYTSLRLLLRPSKRTDRDRCRCAAGVG